MSLKPTATLNKLEVCMLANAFHKKIFRITCRKNRMYTWLKSNKTCLFAVPLAHSIKNRKDDLIFLSWVDGAKLNTHINIISPGIRASNRKVAFNTV